VTRPSIDAVTEFIALGGGVDGSLSLAALHIGGIGFSIER
jgi:hypothetical protein